MLTTLLAAAIVFGPIWLGLSIFLYMRSTHKS